KAPTEKSAYSTGEETSDDWRNSGAGFSWLTEASFLIGVGFQWRRRSPSSTVELFNGKNSVQRSRGFKCGTGFDFGEEEATQFARLGSSTAGSRREWALT
ncbi:hypothetical protein U1Q18_015151, partial [Sarracenia purpurea var. burkii]